MQMFPWTISKWLMAKNISQKKFNIPKVFEYAILAFFVKFYPPKTNLFCGCYKPVENMGIVDGKKVYSRYITSAF